MLQVLCGKRLILMQQAAYVAEAEALGPPLTNHSLATLTQRYSTYKRTKNEYNNAKEALVTMQTNCLHQMTDYRLCLEAIETNKLTEQSNQLNDMMDNFKMMLAPHAFTMVKEFLDNSAQMAIYLQFSQLGTCIDDVIIGQITMAQQAIESIVDYGAVTRYHPRSVLAQHRLAKWAEWCSHLSEHATVQDCRDVAAQCQSTFGKKAINNVLMQQVAAFSYQLQTNICDSEVRLQKLMDRLRMEADESANTDLNGSWIVTEYTTSFEDARNSIRLFLHEPSNKIQQNVFALHCVSISTLCEQSKRLLMMENAAANAGENMVDLTFNGNWVLDELYAHSAIMCEIAFIVESAHREQATNILNNEFLYAEQCLRQIQVLHEHVRTANEQFASNILSDALHGVISENNGVLDIIAALSNLQESLQTIPELLMNLNLHLRRSGMLGGGEQSSASGDVCILRQKLDVLKQQCEQNSGNNAGAKLFLDMNGLFERLDDEYERLMNYVQFLVLRDEQRKIDQMKSSLDLTVRALFFRLFDGVFFKNIFNFFHKRFIFSIRFSRFFTS